MHVLSVYCTGNARLHQQNHAQLVRAGRRLSAESTPNKDFPVYS